MCGLATLDAAQQMRQFWNDLRSKKKPQKEFTWRLFYDIIVQWRQISEPNDPVVWIDLLTREQFEEGFGSHTPMISGQTNVIRYSPMFEKSYPIMKKLISQTGISKEKQEQFQSVTTLAEGYEIIQRDFWVCTPCESVSQAGKIYEGTRLTMQVSFLKKSGKIMFFLFILFSLFLLMVMSLVLELLVLLLDGKNILMNWNLFLMNLRKKLLKIHLIGMRFLNGF